MRLLNSILAVVLCACGAALEPVDAEYHDIRDPRVSRAADAAVTAWEKHIGPVRWDIAVYGAPIGVTDDICNACFQPDGCSVVGCFNPARAAIFLDAEVSEKHVYTFTLPHEYGHVLQWFERGKVDVDHEDPVVWDVVVPEAQSSARAAWE